MTQALSSSIVFAGISETSGANAGGALPASSTTNSTAPNAGLEESGTTSVGISPQPSSTTRMRHSEGSPMLGNLT
ncbi:hypothetical protein V5799_024041, partial [Amblyomma americanum]